jgi:Bacterial protein of unknown function (DUF899)
LRQFGIGTVAVQWFFLLKFPLLFQDDARLVKRKRALRGQGSKVFETYWTTIRGVEAMDNNYRLLDLTVYGRQEHWEDSPTGWPQGSIMDTLRADGRPRAQWSRLKAGHSDDLQTPTGGKIRIQSSRSATAATEIWCRVALWQRGFVF